MKLYVLAVVIAAVLCGLGIWDKLVSARQLLDMATDESGNLVEEAANG